MHFKLASSLTMFPLKSMLGNFLLMYLMAGSMPLSVRKESRFFGSAQVCGEMKAERVGLHIVFFILLTPSFHHLVNISVNIVQMLCFSIQLKAFDLQSSWADCGERTSLSIPPSWAGYLTWNCPGGAVLAAERWAAAHPKRQSCLWKVLSFLSLHTQQVPTLWFLSNSLEGKK